MSKSEEKRIAAQKETSEVKQTREYFYPPQEGRAAFVCEASSQTEADELYTAASSEK